MLTKRMNRTERLILLLFLCVLTALPAFAGEHAAVRVGDQSYSTADVQQYMDESAERIRGTLGMNVKALFTEEEFIQNCVEHFITVAVTDSKLKELGLYDLTPEEEKQLTASAREFYDTIWHQAADRLKESNPDYAEADRLITETMEEAGYSLDAIYDSLLQEYRQQRLLDRFRGEITVTEEEARAWYREEIIAPLEEKYGHDIPLFEKEVMAEGATTPYIPDGYFYIKYLIVSPDGDSAAAVEAAQTRAADAVTALEEAYEAMARATLEEKGADEARAAYLAAEEEATAAAEALDTAMTAAESAMTPLWEIVRSALNDGVRFEELIDRYSEEIQASEEDAGIPFHPESELWDERLSRTISGLTRYGECTAPVYADGYLYIVCRMDNLETGAYEPDPETLEEMRQELLYSRQAEQLSELVGEWRLEMEIETDTTGLVCPE